MTSAGINGGFPDPAPAEAFAVGNLLARSAARGPDDLAVVLPGERVTYAELAARAWRFARSLAGLGARPGDHIGLLLVNSVDYVVAMFGVGLLGAVAVPINARYRTAELSFLAADADLVTIITTDQVIGYVDFAALLADALEIPEGSDPRDLQAPKAPRLRSVVLLGETERAGMVSGAEFDAASEEADEAALLTWFLGVPVRSPAALVYTSGTTANPRGAILTNEALVRAWMSVGARWEMTAADKFWDPTPMFHIASIGPMIFTIGHGAAFLTDAYYRADAALEFIEKERATTLYPTYPPITEALISHPDFAESDL